MRSGVVVTRTFRMEIHGYLPVYVVGNDIHKWQEIRDEHRGE
uniref:Uncharacterized protein n=1 Tax=Candidatus Kentrum sp. LFY TaxID=2126342 RepID=A0A450UYY5_9GAMM|nr:MAG: hypothetical protein BECKLFY1418B_GA0070995_101943 [Candidatus Kentron sp. LFY]VFJ97768.1 MAG: hypothetical protein BECKLFY1418A_GA0070994_107313 [Candidatus Kentron sp. LFY]VFK17375.1 MAG: hypothetical protein BECKLFY1418C_GA0070996_103118 [Candidatus Kentron sp. LFY]